MIDGAFTTEDFEQWLRDIPKRAKAALEIARSLDVLAEQIRSEGLLLESAAGRIDREKRMAERLKLRSVEIRNLASQVNVLGRR